MSGTVVDCCLRHLHPIILVVGFKVPAALFHSSFLGVMAQVLGCLPPAWGRRMLVLDFGLA